MSKKLSVAIAAFNEEAYIGDCIKSVKDIADEIIVVDGTSTDKTAEIARKYGAELHIVANQLNFHINKQKAFDLCTGEWILYLDADERISKELGAEIMKVINMDNREMEEYQKTFNKKKLFERHMKALENRDGKIGADNGEYVAFFFPRSNFFLWKFLRYGGVYPDGVIRLFKNKKADLPGENVHEQMRVYGKVGWLQNDLIHDDSLNFNRYIKRNSRYINLMVDDLKKEKTEKSFFNFISYMFLKPVSWFFSTVFVHKGILDGPAGLIFSFFSALRFPRAYWRYINNK